MAPVICLVSERRRLASRGATLPDLVAGAAAAGVHLVQVREPDLTARELSALVRRCVDAVAGTHARVVVNDRLDVALEAGAHGVHLRGTSFAARGLRALVPPGFLIGRSVHDAHEAGELGGPGDVDYIVAGTVFPTSSKPGRAAEGAGWLAAVVAATTVPVLAIGGVTLDRVSDVARSGAAGLAAIGLFAGAEDVRAVVQGVHERFVHTSRGF
ncbi:MAG: thiamine phosphate synthase [Acidobacteria bacterium]|nr:thiamine phosphate synthase [Acidobacteriota bacterium]